MKAISLRGIGGTRNWRDTIPNYPVPVAALTTHMGEDVCDLSTLEKD